MAVLTRTEQRMRQLGARVHQDPETALCDGPQALFASDFAGFAARVTAHAELCGRVLA
jgi:3-deoxy-D-arabino-heptulosonate 7-phosphate (DAHP) synthase